MNAEKLCIASSTERINQIVKAKMKENYEN